MIRSVQNPRVKAVAKLQRQSRERRRRGLFCIETLRDLERATAAGFSIVELFHRDAAAADPAQRALIERMRQHGAAIEPVSDPVLAKMAYREHPTGIVAVLRGRTTPLAELTPPAEALIVVCSGLEKPGNVGAILRSAAGAGVAAVLIDRPDYDLFNPNCVRASTGAVFGMSIACAERDVVIGWLRRQGRQIVALSPEAERAYTDIDWQGKASVLGAEAEGLDAHWRAAADQTVAIPLAHSGGASGLERGGVDSLNVSVAAAVVMFEAARQRTEHAAR